MFCFIEKKLDTALINNLDTSGRVVASIIIDTSGQVTEVKIVKSLVPEAEEEFIRVLKLMPDWTPGGIGNVQQNVKMHIPLRVPYRSLGCRDGDDEEE